MVFYHSLPRLPQESLVSIQLNGTVRENGLNNTHSFSRLDEKA
jgi:hypothetical protein